MFKAVCIILLLHGCVVARIGNLGVYAQLAQPLGDLSATSGPNAGYHKLGSGLGAELDLPMFSTVNWLTTVSFSIHRYLENEYSGTIPIRMVDSYYFRNLGVLTGLKYQHKVSPDVHLFYFIQIGMNRLTVPPFEGVFTESARQIQKVRYKFAPVLQMGGALGFGIYFERYAMSIRYLNFGRSATDAFLELNDNGLYLENVDTFSTTVALLQITFGVNFEFY